VRFNLDERRPPDPRLSFEAAPRFRSGSIVAEDVPRSACSWRTALPSSRAATARLVIEADPDAASFYRRMGRRGLWPHCIRLNTRNDAAKAGQELRST
jgi:hypothetical protein